MTLEATRAAYPRFPHHTLTLNRDNRDQIITTAETLRAAVQVGVFMSLGATDLTAVAGAHELGGLLFTAVYSPFATAPAATAPHAWRHDQP